MRRTVVLLMIMGAIFVLAAGVAMAATYTCTKVSPNVCSGTSDNDTITGDDRANTIDGLGGRDTLYGKGGADWLWGRGGGDWLYGGFGNDVIEAGSGKDKLYDQQSGDKDYLYGREEGDELDADDGENTKTTTGEFDPDGPNRDFVNGGSSDDTCRVDAGDEFVYCQFVYVDGKLLTTTTTSTVTSAANADDDTSKEKAKDGKLPDDGIVREAPTP